jgi:hypothetical protein
MCYTNCYAASCIELKSVFGIYRDGEYNLNISSKIIKVWNFIAKSFYFFLTCIYFLKIYCKNMNTIKPLEYITLKSELENYSEIYDKKYLIKKRFKIKSNKF